MASTWGNSWLTSWGTSWDATVTPPTPPAFAGGGGGGRTRYEVIYPRRGKSIDQKIGEWIEAIVVGEVEATPEVAQIRKVVAPYVRKDTIDLAAMQRDARQIRVLLQAYEADIRRRAEDDDEELLMVM